MSTVLTNSAAVRGAAAGLQVELVQTLARMKQLAPHWRELLRLMPGRNLFLTPAWNIAWWQAFGNGRTLHLLALREEGRLVGLVVLMRYRMRLRGMPVRVLGSLTNEHVSRTDVLALPGREADVADALAAHLAACTGVWDVTMLQQLPANAPWVAPFLHAARERGLLPLPAVAGIGKCRMPLAQSWDAYVKSRGGHFHRNIGKTERRIERAGSVSYRFSHDPAADANDFEIFADVESRSWKNDPEGGAALGAAGWDFQRQFACAYDDGISCDNLVVELDGRPVGIVHTVGYERVSYCFQTLYDHSLRELYIGRAAVTRHFQRVFDSGRYDAIDFNGNGPFCKSWCDTEQGFISLQVHHRRPYSALLWLGRKLQGSMKKARP